jgi:iduronate 2-sulfatase
MKRSKETMLKLPATEGPIDVPDDAYMDGMIADRAVSELKKLATSDQPFMLAVGFNKPHLPLNAPAPYWSHYNPMSPPAQPQRTSPPNGMSPFAPRPFNEVESFGGALPRMPEGSSKDDHIRHAYAASTTYADAQIGKVLDTLEELGLSDNTIIVLWGDHGWHLGDLGMWAKHTNFEASARCPLIISAPGGQQGQQTDSLVETVDIFPTLLDLCGLPALPVSDGTSLRPVLEDPSRPWKQAAYHCVDRYIKPSPDQKAVLHLGRAVRTDRFRYVEWRNGWDAGSRLAGRELYDYADQDFETVNVADDPAYAEVVKRMSELLWAWDGQPGLDGDAEVPTPLAALEVVR